MVGAVDSAPPNSPREDSRRECGHCHDHDEQADSSFKRRKRRHGVVEREVPYGEKAASMKRHYTEDDEDDRRKEGRCGAAPAEGQGAYTKDKVRQRERRNDQCLGSNQSFWLEAIA
jgi:hypothetical protein